jgi:hypothetical protein
MFMTMFTFMFMDFIHVHVHVDVDVHEHVLFTFLHILYMFMYFEHVPAHVHVHVHIHVLLMFMSFSYLCSWSVNHFFFFRGLGAEKRSVISNMLIVECCLWPVVPDKDERDCVNNVMWTVGWGRGESCESQGVGQLLADQRQGWMWIHHHEQRSWLSK